VAKDLIVKLLDKDRSKRLGAKGGKEVLAHPFFAQVNLDLLL